MLTLDAEFYRRSLWAFVQAAWPLVEPAKLEPNWHQEVICQHLERCSRRELKRLIINVPPGSTKSLLTGVFWPAWHWIERPAEWWMFASFDEGLCNRDSGKLIRLLKSVWYLRHFGPRLLTGGVQGVKLFESSFGGGRYNTSFGGGGTGRHCGIQVIDDPIKPRNAAGGYEISGKILDSTYDTIAHTFASRAKTPENFVRVLIMQRIHEADPAGRLIDEGWPCLRIPLLRDDSPDPHDPRPKGECLQPSRWPPEVVETLRREATDLGFETQYQQNPSSKTGGIFNESLILRDAMSQDEVASISGSCIQSWDFAFKAKESSDYVAGQHWKAAWWDGAMHYFLASQPDWEQLTFVQCLARLRQRRVDWPASAIYVEDKANGPALENVLSEEMQGLITLVDPKGSKVARAHAVSPLFGRDEHKELNLPAIPSRVHLLRGPYLARMASVLGRFPRVRWDDEVDALTQALSQMKSIGNLVAAMDRLRRPR